MPPTLGERSSRARASLAGLSTGDAFGDRFFELANRHVPPETGVPPAPWEWSDDTEMACSVVDVLNRFGQIDQDALARSRWPAIVGGIVTAHLGVEAVPAAWLEAREPLPKWLTQ